MWQRFSENARRVVFFAQEEAQGVGEGYVSTEHLLLGLVREECTATRVLHDVGIDLALVRTEVLRMLPRGEPRTSQDMTLTPRAKRVIDLAYDEARQLNDQFIGTEHLLLGLIREHDGLAGRMLEKMDLTMERARATVAVVRGKDPPKGFPRPQTPMKRIKEAFGLIKRQDATFSMFLSLQSTTRTCMLVLAVMDHSPRLAKALLSVGVHAQDFSNNVVAESVQRVENATVVELSLQGALARASELAEGRPTDPGHLVLAILEQDGPLRTRVGLDEAQLAELAKAINLDR
ncbi:MAG: hypothetical protein JST30_12460 [Armatimonadetes bacterium]|nr:hypothetical protein [Armatimonadota bacterium]